jgi:hypothetical protein
MTGGNGELGSQGKSAPPSGWQKYIAFRDDTKEAQMLQSEGKGAAGDALPFSCNSMGGGTGGWPFRVRANCVPHHLGVE